MTGSLHPAAAVVTEADGEMLYVARLPEGPIIMLDAIGELIWRELAGRTRDELTGRIAAQVGASIESIAADIESFVDELIGLGLILEAR